MNLKWGSLLVYIGIALIFQSNSCYAKGSRVAVASAQTLAERAGAAHYEEHYEPIESSEESSEHRLRKRASDEDFDYEVYQGVVGRPGIDFPIHARIPQTSFSCRKFGHGYFADLEAECQVFHICDGGRKISFLCPNGTIFQQPELICDWWFKVNCGKSPGFYADSAEMLSRAQNHRKNQNKRIENEFQAEGRNGYQSHGSKSSVNKSQYPIKSSRKYEESDRLNEARKLDRRIDSEENASVETVDFEDITEGTRTYHKKNDKFQSRHAEVNDSETQILAESASFVGNNRNGYNYEQPNQESKRNSAERTYSHEESNNRAKNDRGRHKYGGYRSNVYKNGNQPKQYSNEDVAEVSTYGPLSYQSTVKPNPTPRVHARGTTVRPNTYTTARRFDVSKTTPFYTPTVPTVLGRFGEYKSTPATPQSGKINFNIISSTLSPIVQKKISSQFQQSSRNNQAPKEFVFAKPSSFKSAPTSQPSSTPNYFTPASELSSTTKYFNAISNPTGSPNYFTPTEQPSRSTSGYFPPSPQPTSTPGQFSTIGYFTTSTPDSNTPTYFTPSVQPSNAPKYYISDGRRPAVNFGQNLEISTTPAFNSDYSDYSTISSGHVDFSQKLSSPTPFTLAERTSNSIGKEVHIQIKPHKHNDAEYIKQSAAHSLQNSGSVEILGNDQTDVNIRVTTPFPVEVITGRSFASAPQEDKAKISISNGYNYRGPAASEDISTTTLSYSTQQNDISTLSPSQLNPSDLAVEVGTPNTIEAKRNIFSLAKNPTVSTHSPSSFSRNPQYSTIRNFDVMTYTPQTSSSSSQTYLPNQSSTVTTTYDDQVPTTYRPIATTVESSVSDHVKDMIKTLNELKVDLKVNEPSSREGLDIPPSSGPETLLSLAGYFASSEENASTTESAQTSTSDSEVEHIKPELSISNLSGKTVEKYENLFGLAPTTEPPTEPALGPDFQPNNAPDTNDLEGQHSTGLLGGAAGKPETRKIAQVFTNALSAYLQDPTSFRRVLSEVRPTEPPVSYEAGKQFGSGTAASNIPTSATGATMTPTTIRPKNGLEVLDYSDVTIAPGNEQQELVTSKTISADITTTDESIYGNPATSTAIPTYVDRVPASRIITENLIKQGSKLEARGPSETATDSNAVAVEINKGLGLSTVVPYLSLSESIAARKPAVDIFTSAQPIGTSRSDEFTAEWSTTLSPQHVPLTYALLPPVGKLTDSDLENNFDDDEDTLQRAQSQSFVTARNNLNKLDFQNKFKSNLKLSTASPLNNFSHAGHFITRLMSDITVTTELPESRKVTSNPWTTASYTTYIDPLTINDELMGEKQLRTTTSSPHTYLPRSTPNPINVEVQDADAIGSSTVNFGLIHPEIPEDILPPSNGMQRIASKMFGNLDVNSANHLMSVMKKAESNQTVRRLILLLIQTCDEDYSKTVEQSRKVLLNALIGMDQKLSGDDEVEVIKLSPKRRSKSIDASSGPANLVVLTSETTPTTAYHGSISTTSDYSYSTTSQTSSVEETTKFEIRVADPDEDSFGLRTSTLKPFESESSTIATTQEPTSYSTTTEAPISVTTTPRSSKRRTKDVSDSLGQPGLFADLSHKNSDERALDLLKSLYSLASKFSRR